MTVYVVSRQVDGRNLIAGVYRDRADAAEDVTDSIGEHQKDTIDCVRTGGEITVFDCGSMRHIVYPFELQ